MATLGLSGICVLVGGGTKANIMESSKSLQMALSTQLGAMMSKDILTDAATTLGNKHGRCLAEKLAANDIGFQTAKDIVRGHEKREPEIMALCPEPLEGSFGDEPSPMFILDDVAELAEGVQVIKYDEEENVLEAYENAYKESFWATMIEKMKDIIDGQEN